MPSQLPSSFASAAAGQTRDSRGSGRGDAVRGSGSGEWPRSNGTRTFRRPSTTPFNQSTSANSTDLPQNSAADAHSHSTNQPGAFDAPGSYRYSKEELLDIYKNTHDLAQSDASSLFMPNWNPTQVNGSSTRGWGKSGDSGHIPQDPTVCWDPSGLVTPIGLDAMSAEERELFAGDVNSTLKIPQQTKDGVHQSGGGPNGRKTSVSANTNTTNYPLSSPSTATRPGVRRRETAENSPFPTASVASPTTNSRFSRDDPWLARRGTDLKETIVDEPEQAPNVRETPTRGQSFTLGRGNSTGAGNFGASPASMWGATSNASTSGIGAFGSFALGGTATIGEKRQGTGGSRLAHLIPPKDSADSPTSKPSPIEATSSDMNRGWRPRQRTDTDPFGGEDSASGSAILGGAQDNSPPSMQSQIQRGNVFDTPVKGSTGDFGMSGLNLGAAGAGNGPASPSETNPYRSPLADRAEDNHDDNEIERLTHAGPSSEQPASFNTLPRSFGATAFDGSDRSQTSSVGAKGFPTVNTMTGWPAPPPSATPDRERQGFNSAFGASIFSPVDNLPTSSLGGMGGVFGASGTSSIGRGSKLGSLFPAAMQAQMHGHDQDSLGDSVPDLRQSNPLGAIGRGVIGSQSRDTGSPVRGGRGGFEDLFPSDANRSPFTTGDGQPGLTSTTAASFSSGQSSGDPSAMRTMVMPDRMRWVYLDPQGTMQGPFSGLEMNDWYKANFFTPDLRVRRLEDPDFEPLGQLIRRIGNSREPFLVPQMGIPHGPPPAPGTPFTMGGSTEAVPPLQSAFPSFGRTLTAAQQNDLERRKQEEQLYHARQREIAHHHHHPVAFGRLPMQPSIPSLHHHSSAHSLQSQPSFGSMTSPIGMAPQSAIGAIGPNSGFFDGPPSMAPGATPSSAIAPPENFPPDLNFGERQLLANMHAAGGLPGIYPQQPVGAPGNDNAGLRSQLPGVDQLQKDSQGFSTRLREFEELRAQHDAEEAAAAAGIAHVIDDSGEQKEQAVGRTVAAEEVVAVTKAVITQSPTEVTVSKKVAAAQTTHQQQLSLTERVRKTQADAAAAAAAAAVAAAAVVKPVQQPSSSGLPMPFPPPQSSTPLAAPTAQRPVSNLPSRYGDRSATGTPDTSSDGASLAPPPTAPWAVQPGAEAQKGPSLKEIQEAEAKKAAKKEEAAAALRRAALEQEAAALREREKAAAAINVGLPATSTWGTGSPVGAPAAGSPWKQPATVKTAAAGIGSSSTPSKKTLAEIQREEELRKQKAREAAARQSAAVSVSSGGKRYADLASKGPAPPGLVGAASPAVQMPASGWSTVGAGGKVKIPTGPAAQTRTVSGTSVKVQSVPVVQKLAPKATIGLKDAKGVALEEFKKWLHRELTRGLVGVDNVDHFGATLLEMPLDPLILSEAVYCYSTTMDGRHFAEEFVRRKKLADKGVVDKESSVNESKNNSSNGGWNEVAKKGGSNAVPKEDASVAGFKIVPSKKTKGKK